MIFSSQIKLIYLVGLIASGFFISIYLYYKIREDAINTILNALLLGSGSYMIYTTFVYRIDDDIIIGRICAGSYCLIYFFPLIIIYRAFKHKNYKLIPFYKVLCSLFHSIFWIIYGIMIKEEYVVLPHYINLVLSPIQIALFYNYKKRYKIIEENDKDSDSTIEISSNEETQKINKNKINKKKEKNYVIKPIIILGNNNNEM